MPAAVPSAAKLCRCSQQGLRGWRRAFGGGRATATVVDPGEALEQPAAHTLPQAACTVRPHPAPGCMYCSPALCPRLHVLFTRNPAPGCMYCSPTPCPRLHVLFAHNLPQAACTVRPQPAPQRRWRAARAGSMRVPPLPSACPPACFWLPTHAAPPHPLAEPHTILAFPLRAFFVALHPPFIAWLCAGMSTLRQLFAVLPANKLQPGLALTHEACKSQRQSGRCRWRCACASALPGGGTRKLCRTHQCPTQASQSRNLDKPLAEHGKLSACWMAGARAAGCPSAAPLGIVSLLHACAATGSCRRASPPGLAIPCTEFHDS